MVENHSDSEKGKPLVPLGIVVFLLPSRDLLYAPFYRQNSTYHSLC